MYFEHFLEIIGVSTVHPPLSLAFRATSSAATIVQMSVDWDDCNGYERAKAVHDETEEPLPISSVRKFIREIKRFGYDLYLVDRNTAHRFPFL